MKTNIIPAEFRSPATTRSLQDQIARIYGQDYDPVLHILAIAHDKETSNALKLSALKEVCKYVRPQYQSVQDNAAAARQAPTIVILDKSLPEQVINPLEEQVINPLEGAAPLAGPPGENP